MLTRNHHPEPTGDITVTPGVHSTGLGRCMTRIHHDGLTQSSFSALKTLCALQSPPHPDLVIVT